MYARFDKVEVVATLESKYAYMINMIGGSILASSSSLVNEWIDQDLYDEYVLELFTENALILDLSVVYNLNN